jgi:transposase
MKNTNELFELALQLAPSWHIKDIQFKPTKGKSKGQLDIYLDFRKGTRFKDDSENLCAVHDTLEKTWRHLDFFQHTCYLHARVPRIKTANGKVSLVQVPWARSNSGFTLLFEAFAMTLIENEMPVNKAASLLNVYANRLWTIFNYWIRRAFSKDDPRDIKHMGIDETSSRKGHNYVTLSVDLKEKRTIFVTPGKDETSIKNICCYLKDKNVNLKQITHAAIDMSIPFISGLTKYFPDTAIVFDRFHLKKMINKAMDDLRKTERRHHEQLKGSKYVFLKNQKNLTAKQKDWKFDLIESFPKLGEAVRLVELFDDLFTFDNKEQASAYLAYWCDMAEESSIQVFQECVKTLQSHWQGIINYAENKLTTGFLEGLNSKIQLAKRRARGFRNIDNFINMIYFLTANLKFDYPRIST